VEGRAVNIVTSFHKAGFEVYGRKFLETFKKYWPSSVNLTIYFEDDHDRNPNFNWEPISSVEFLDEYMAKLRFPLFHGVQGNKYNINWDARMARKSFIQMHAMNKFKGKVFWIDSDVITHEPVTEAFLNSVLPDDKFNCYLGRDGWMYTESGFIGFNGDHRIAEKFRAAYLSVFMTGAIFIQPGWHDCYGFDATRKAMMNDVDFVNLAKDCPHGTDHVFINSVLGSVMDHRKGNRKHSRSDPSELVFGREEKYWQ
jgi:hypothetical protein